MSTQQLLDRVRDLRAAGRTPKEIARALKMPPSAVAPLIRSVAAAEGRPRGGCNYENLGIVSGVAVGNCARKHARKAKRD
jgi:hypothetical protein